MPGGRPTDYGPAIVKAAWLYVSDDEKRGWAAVGDKVPSVAGMACEIGIHRDTAYAWAAQDDNAFSDILKEIKQKQERKLVNSGLDGEYKEGITKMMLAKHGYADAVSQQNFNVTISGDDADL